MTDLEQVLVAEMRNQLTQAWSEVNRLKVQLAEARSSARTPGPATVVESENRIVVQELHDLRQRYNRLLAAAKDVRQMVRSGYRVLPIDVNMQREGEFLAAIAEPEPAGKGAGR